jgi:hypothetical protein
LRTKGDWELSEKRSWGRKRRLCNALETFVIYEIEINNWDS